MNKLLENALGNVKNRPAAYTIMITVIVFGIAGLSVFEGNNLLYAFIAVLITIIISLFLVLKSDKMQIIDNPGNTSPSSAYPLVNQVSKLEKVCKIVSDGKSNDHPLLIMLGGFMIQLSEEIAKNSIEIAPKYYFSCFSNLDDIESANIYAIADLNADLEKWDTGHATLWKGVNERLFHIRWMDLYNDNLKVFIAGLEQDFNEIQNSGCDISIITSRETEKLSLRHPLTDMSEIGKHLLIIGDSLIGGYIHTPDGDKLYLQAANEKNINSAKNYFRKLKNNAVSVSPNISVKELRAKWVEKYGIGLWDPEWNGKQERDDRYVSDYDRHIYCWIPEYETILNTCFRTVITELDRYCRTHQKSIRVLEIGCGTGILTERIMEWIVNLDNLLDDPINEFRIVDQSSQMLEITKLRLKEKFKKTLNKFTKFDQLKFTDDYNNDNGKRYDLIYGSLIFHFLLGCEWNSEKIINIFDKLKSDWLSEDGCIIFADIFFTKNNRIAEEEYWNDHMSNFGMSSSSIDIFFKNNKDMISSPDFETMSDSLLKNGLSIEIHKTPTCSNPFNVIKIKRAAPSSEHDTRSDNC